MATPLGSGPRLARLRRVLTASVQRLSNLKPSAWLGPPSHGWRAAELNRNRLNLRAVKGLIVVGSVTTLFGTGFRSVGLLDCETFMRERPEDYEYVCQMCVKRKKK